MISTQGLRGALSALRLRWQGADVLDLAAEKLARVTVIAADVSEAVAPAANVARWSARCVAAAVAAGNRPAVELRSGPHGSLISIQNVSATASWVVSGAPVLASVVSNHPLMATAGPAPLAAARSGPFASAGASDGHPALIASFAPPTHPPIFLAAGQYLTIYKGIETGNLAVDFDGRDLAP